MKTTTVNLFATSKVKETAKKPEKKIIKAELLEDKISRFNRLKDEIEAATGELKMIEGDIKTAGRELFIKEYRQFKIKPESFKIQDKTGASCLFICMDKYISVDENKAEILGEFDNLLDEKQTFKINAELIEKYGDVLSKLIMTCKAIDEEDKLNLIQGEKQYSVKKGTIERLLQYENPEMVFELINPIVSLKK
jgi:hypothetical protein